MVATPARIAISLNDGFLLSHADPTIKAANYNAVSNDNEIESFFDLQSDAQAMLDERWGWQSIAGRPRDQIEVDSGFNLGTKIALAPIVPEITITDATRGVNGVTCIVRAYSIDYNTERYAVEIIGLGGGAGVTLADIAFAGLLAKLVNGTPSNGTLTGALAGSSFSLANAPPGFTVDRVAMTWAYDGTPF